MRSQGVTEDAWAIHLVSVCSSWTRLVPAQEVRCRNEAVKDALKSTLASAISASSSQCHYQRSIFILAHMRCGSTALSNILCSRDDVSGYGEAHVAYRRSRDVGRLVLNQLLRRTWRPRARYLFDKILHNRHDGNVPPEFFRSRAIFLCREPVPTIISIRRLFEKLGKADYPSDEAATVYYIERLEHLSRLWVTFRPEHRLGLTHRRLTAETEASLSRISRLLDLDPPLMNRYESKVVSRIRGGGDPTMSGRLSRIVAGTESSSPGEGTLGVDAALLRHAQKAYDAFVALIGESGHDLVLPAELTVSTLPTAGGAVR